ncbi:MAG: hypothetical protein F6K42_35640, partial [Leptolyngbya sp. SIO1D8]|nr:hypothetical protein [Leptolyngbya sp. SIO1D8]
MKSKDHEYKEIFLAEALENYEELNRLLTLLEKKPDDTKSINAIFRITHTLKGNAAGMGFKKVADFAHVMEDLFGEVREGNLSLDGEIFTSLFKALDVLGALINAIKDDSNVQFRGIKTKLEVLLKSARKDDGAVTAEGKPAENVTEKQEPKRQKSTTTKRSAKKRQSTTKSKDEKTTDKKATPDEKPIAEAESIPPETPVEEEATDTKIAFSDLVQVPVRKLDNLLNLVGELIIERDRIIAANSGKVDSNEYARLNRVSSDLQYSVMDVRLV